MANAWESLADYPDRDYFCGKEDETMQEMSWSMWFLFTGFGFALFLFGIFWDLWSSKQKGR